ncbi:TonB-dependent receptor domain-containing protein [Sphingosinicella terrae]|uniref:TonB-dependent receptor domain-containing protein n=1 Tax=Sphingosinicella terrae TaxID=2172047 RepID=UPI000E0D41FF|nr:TonB-dependent receptor [Sphingosinicella terrae]
MKKSLILGGLLASTALAVQPAFAQDAEAPAASAPAAEAVAAPEGQQEDIEISVPGADLSSGPDIVVTGTRSRNIVQRAPEVISVLSSEDIARAGDGDIAGALQRVTGLSVVGNGFVFVRGLGDRYSLALLNGSPLPSPEPLRRVVPLDIFPTSVIASSLVQKSYSVAYPGEFGGGVINLTTPSAPRDPFLQLGGSVSFDTESSFQLGYAYYGSDLDPFGFDDGTRDFPADLRAAVEGGTFGETSSAERQAFAASLSNAPTTLLQRMSDTPANFSGELSAGSSFDIGATRLGVIAAFGYSNNWRTRDALQQTSLDPQLAGTPQTDFRSVTTDNRILVNGLLGLGLSFGEHQLRWTNLYIRDTLKQARLSAGSNRNVADQDPDLPPSLLEQNTYWFERQLIDTQLVGEFRFGNVSVDLRGTYANTQRESPYERSIGYFYLGDGDPTTKSASDVDDYINNLSSAGQFANIAFSDLTEDLYAGQGDLSWRLPTAMPVTLSAGYYYSRTERSASRYQFQYFRPEGALRIELAQQRPDYLLSDFNIFNYGIELRDVSGAEGTAAYEADLEIHAGYVQAEIEPIDGVRLQTGVRYEDADQRVQPIGGALEPTSLANDYWLPAATLTWNVVPDVQLRLHGSRTIARPQFRELAPQIYQDFESDREFTGNPFLVDSELTNAEARIEYYFLPQQRVTLAGFYKKIDNPIEAAAFFAGGGQLRTGFANAPEAELYGIEAEVQAFLPLDGLGGAFFATRRLVLIGNYTWTQSSISADDSLIVGPDLQPVAANLLFRDGAPLTGQSDHLANLQIGIEDTDRLSQMTVLVTYASERVTNRGPIQGEERQPDIRERPGIQLDFVARQEARLFDTRIEFSFEARNLLGEDYREFQAIDGNRIDINSYRRGRIFSLGAKVNF